MAEIGIPFLYRGRGLRLRAISLEDVKGGNPRWIVDIDGSQGMAHSLEGAVLQAARGADSIAAAEPGKQGKA